MVTLRIRYRDNNARIGHTVLRCLTMPSDGAVASLVSALSGISNATITGVSLSATYHLPAATPAPESDVWRLLLVIVGNDTAAQYSYLVPSPVTLPTLARMPDVVDAQLLPDALRDAMVSVGSVAVGATRMRAAALWR